MVLRPIPKVKNRDNLRRRIFAFDVETYGNENLFYMGSVYSDFGYKVFYDKEEMKKYLLSRYILFSNCYVVATNLMFDFFSLWTYGEFKNFYPLFRGSELLSVKYKTYYGNKKRTIDFIDTFHFATKISLKKLGKIIGIEKLPSPKCLGKIPKNNKEKEELEKYNIQDSRITYEFTKFFQDSLIEAGTCLKTTIASISMDYFRRNFLKDNYDNPSHETCTELFKSYYGGRTEAFKRGKIRNKKYYDINSLYPYCMTKEYPNPNSIKEMSVGNQYMVDNYEGVSFVYLQSPNDLNIPYLPKRQDSKLIFPLGVFWGSYTHFELREAIKRGYKILKFDKCFYFLSKISPFKDFVNKTYNKRMELKKENNPMEFTYKIILNSLYGKFAQKYEEVQDVYFAENENDIKHNKYFDVELLDEKIYLCKRKNTKVPKFLQPIWSIYTTAYARHRLYEYFEKVGFDNVYYCDTDSVFTSKEIVTSDDIGAMKLEDDIIEGVIVKPKVYVVNDYVKVKGFKGLDREEDLFNLLEEGNLFTYQKFTKVKESIRSKNGIKVNEIVDVQKSMSFEDNKRCWGRKSFDRYKLQFSKPIILYEQEEYRDIVFEYDRLENQIY